MLKSEEQETNAVSEQRKLPHRVILTGFRATGKSLVGSRVAEMLGYRFVDTDRELAAQMQCSIADFVREHGWPAFRKLEKELLVRLALMQQVVIATGGGAVLHHEEWRDLRRDSLVVWLRADAGTIRKRMLTDAVSSAQRPPLTSGGKLQEIEAVLAEREPIYREGADMTVETGGRSPDEIADLIRHYINNLDP